MKGCATDMTSVHSGRYQSLLRRLRAARQAAGLTQVAVARAVGRPQSYVSKCESGERRIDALELYEFAELYGLSVGHFVGETGRRYGASLTSERSSRPRSRPRRKRRS